MPRTCLAPNPSSHGYLMTRNWSQYPDTRCHLPISPHTRKTPFFPSSMSESLYVQTLPITIFPIRILLPMGRTTDPRSFSLQVLYLQARPSLARRWRTASTAGIGHSRSRSSRSSHNNRRTTRNSGESCRRIAPTLRGN